MDMKRFTDVKGNQKKNIFSKVYRVCRDIPLKLKKHGRD